MAVQPAGLRDRIVDAAIRLISGSGDASAVPLRAIAELAGCTAPAIYTHFGDRDALILAAGARVFGDLQDAMCRAGSGIADPVDALRAEASAYVRFGLEHPEAYRVIFMTPFTPAGEIPFEELPGYEAFSRVVERVETCVSAGAFGPCDAFETATVLWAGVHGLVSLLITLPRFPTPPVDDLLNRLLEVQLNGLRPRK